MSFDGSHLICEKCSGKTTYSDIERKWICAKCRVDEIDTE